MAELVYLILELFGQVPVIDPADGDTRISSFERDLEKLTSCGIL
jgi:hypothetical protein